MPQQNYNPEGFGRITGPGNKPWYPPTAIPERFGQDLQQARQAPGSERVNEMDVMEPTEVDSWQEQLQQNLGGGMGARAVEDNKGEEEVKSPQERLLDSLKSFSDKLIKIISR